MFWGFEVYMEYIIRIEDKKDSFTQTDKNIASYILNNKDLIIKQSSIDLAKNTKSSQAAVTRFVKKIGYNSFVDMKISIAKAFEEESDFIEDEIKKSDKTKDIINKSKANIHWVLTRYASAAIWARVRIPAKKKSKRRAKF